MPHALTTVGYIAQTGRAHGVDMDATTAWSVHPLRLLELVAPGFMGNANQYDSYLGYFLYDGAEGLPMPWILSPYLGSLSIAFAVAAFTGLRAQNKKTAIAITSVTLFALLLSMGRYTPVFGIYHKLMPGTGFVRYPAKFFPLFSLGLSLLAAFGLDACLKWKQNRDRSLPGAIAAGAVICSATLIGTLFSGQIGKSLSKVSYWIEVGQEKAIDTVKGALMLEAGVSMALLLGLILVGLKKSRWLAPAVVAGTVVGERLHDRVNEHHFRVVVFAILLLAGVSVVVF